MKNIQITHNNQETKDFGQELAKDLLPVYHIDAYRIETKDIEHLGFEEWCSDPKGLVILEWPERVPEVLPEKRIDINLEQEGEDERKITCNVPAYE